MDAITSVAALKRALTVGTVLDVTAHRWEALTGFRTVLKANTVGMYLSLPDGHPRRSETPDGSFMDWPKSGGLTVNSDGTLTVASVHGGEFLATFRIHPVKELLTDEDKRNARDVSTCGTCNRSWDDGISTSLTPVPSARCPFEYAHVYDED